MYTIIKLLECFENKTFNYPQELPVEIINEYIVFIIEYKSRDIPIKSKLIITECITMFWCWQI